MPALTLAALFLAACAAGPVPASGEDPEPSPDLTPQEVVRLQVEALREGGDRGIATAFRFASPENREVTGPLARFAEMLRRGYPDMLGAERAEFGRMVFSDGEAAQHVTLVQADGERTAYVFALSRQSGGACDGCWMTDAVVPAPVPSDGMIRV